MPSNNCSYSKFWLREHWKDKKLRSAPQWESIRVFRVNPWGLLFSHALPFASPPSHEHPAQLANPSRFYFFRIAALSLRVTLPTEKDLLYYIGPDVPRLHDPSSEQLIDLVNFNY